MSKNKLFIVALLLTVCSAAFAQKRVSGVVTGAEDALPLEGVVVSIKGTTTGTVTDARGQYSIQAPSDADLEFSCLGYETLVINVAGRQTINVSLAAESTVLDEVLVTAVGIQRTERSLGYSVTKVDADNAVQKAEPDLLRALDGKIAGVQVSAPSGDAGGATRITIRGNSSFLGNNQPLYVVDGVPYSNDGNSASGRGGDMGGALGSGIATLDPNDIESMSVLKGAAAAVLYGSRAESRLLTTDHTLLKASHPFLNSRINTVREATSCSPDQTVLGAPPSLKEQPWICMPLSQNIPILQQSFIPTWAEKSLIRLIPTM